MSLQIIPDMYYVIKFFLIPYTVPVHAVKRLGLKKKVYLGRFLLFNFEHYKNNSYATNIQLLKYATQPSRDKKMIYQT